MVRRFVENEEVRLQDQHIGQCDAFLLSAAQLSHRLFQVVEFQHGENLLRPQNAFRVALMIEAGIQYALFRIEIRALFEQSHTQVVAVDDGSVVIALLVRQYGEQGRLSRTVLCHESYVLAFSDGE